MEKKRQGSPWILQLVWISWLWSHFIWGCINICLALKYKQPHQAEIWSSFLTHVFDREWWPPFHSVYKRGKILICCEEGSIGNGRNQCSLSANQPVHREKTDNLTLKLAQAGSFTGHGNMGCLGQGLWRREGGRSSPCLISSAAQRGELHTGPSWTMGEGYRGPWHRECSQSRCKKYDNHGRELLIYCCLRRDGGFAALSERVCKGKVKQHLTVWNYKE